MRYGLLNLHIGSADAGEGLVCDAGDGGAATMSLGVSIGLPLCCGWGGAGRQHCGWQGGGGAWTP